MDVLKRAVEAGRRAVEGIYAAQFVSNADQYGEGIIVLDKGKIHGGDLDNVYVGTFSVRNNEIAATVDITNYSGNVWSVVGLRQYRLTVKGAMKNSQNITVAGVVEGRADLAIKVNLRKLSHLVDSSSQST
ncbi:MAG TPA: GrlR family regulatory protein [Nitrospira sp.]|nr:GrlR family regulatory protein [Nitrospira sp.]